MLFGCERSCSSPRRVSNCNSKVHLYLWGGGGDERDRLNICPVRVFTSCGSTGGRGVYVKTIISPNT